VIIGLFFSCANEDKNNFSSSDTIPESDDNGLIPFEGDTIHDNTLKESTSKLELTKVSDSSYCYIEEALNHNNGTFLKVDFIQFFTFERALEEAKKRGDADYHIADNGDTNYMVYNDYYIANDNPKLRIFELTDSTSIELLEMFGGTKMNINNNVAIMKRVENSPFIIVVKDGQITRLEEVFIP
jgi:hypothetical protein